MNKATSVETSSGSSGQDSSIGLFPMMGAFLLLVLLLVGCIACARALCRRLNKPMTDSADPTDF